ncbi:hypothetical protein DFA_07565 [Cavenderia fasciculata]|uniref:Uncharacterized protein n=1 Tax=Cavenderia fasciculata TaxID=261658 RepID=F4PWS7_CACFS|nr:uncharacterized protein DFA_07565 [Cavenderia fasciculata]EGG20441.1 hypothetical protein DFA_07565 [Cavenderia fasciculata]|eukprot:XP_004367424.1 hypothetical protein DFA_07565 [Cavenderia fasciculata]
MQHQQQQQSRISIVIDCLMPSWNEGLPVTGQTSPQLSSQQQQRKELPIQIQRTVASHIIESVIEYSRILYDLFNDTTSISIFSSLDQASCINGRDTQEQSLRFMVQSISNINKILNYNIGKPTPTYSSRPFHQYLESSIESLLHQDENTLQSKPFTMNNNIVVLVLPDQDGIGLTQFKSDNKIYDIPKESQLIIDKLNVQAFKKSNIGNNNNNNNNNGGNDSFGHLTIQKCELVVFKIRSGNGKKQQQQQQQQSTQDESYSYQRVSNQLDCFAKDCDESCHATTRDEQSECMFDEAYMRGSTSLSRDVACRGHPHVRAAAAQQPCLPQHATLTTRYCFHYTLSPEPADQLRQILTHFFNLAALNEQALFPHITKANIRKEYYKKLIHELYFFSKTCLTTQLHYDVFLIIERVYCQMTNTQPSPPPPHILKQHQQQIQQQQQMQQQQLPNQQGQKGGGTLYQNFQQQQNQQQQNNFQDNNNNNQYDRAKKMIKEDDLRRERDRQMKVTNPKMELGNVGDGSTSSLVEMLEKKRKLSNSPPPKPNNLFSMYTDKQKKTQSIELDGRL